MTSRGQKFKSYTKDLKLEIVKLRLTGVSLIQLSKQYQITDSMMINWVKTDQELSEDGLISQQGQKYVSNILKTNQNRSFLPLKKRMNTFV